MCGLWLPFLSEQLRWERADRSGWSFARLPEFPSWSWASQGRIKAGDEGTDASRIETVGVQWHTWWEPNAKCLFKVEMVRCVSGATNQTGGHPGLDERGPLAISLPLSGDYGIENRFLALRIKGRLARDFYLKQEWPGGQHELDRAAALTENYWSNPGLTEKHQDLMNFKSHLCTDKAWYQIMHGETLVGWVSFDDTNVRVDNTDSGPCIAGDGRRAIFALRLSKITGNLVYSETIGTDPDVYALLFVAKCEARIGDEFCFERVGVGRMIQHRAFNFIDDYFEKGSAFWLV